MNDEGLFVITSNLPMNEKFLSLALFDEQIREHAIGVEVLEVDADNLTESSTIEFKWEVTKVSDLQIEI